MLVSEAVQKRWEIGKHETLVLIPLKTSRIYEVIKNIAMSALYLFSLGLINYWHPQLQDQIYYALFYHRKIEKRHKPICNLPDQMNFNRFETLLKKTGWEESIANLKPLVLANRAPKLNLNRLIKKILNFFKDANQEKPSFSITFQPIKQLPNLVVKQDCLNKIDYGFALSPGAKKTMEDIIHIDHFNFKIKGVSEKVYSFILMDGHGIQKSQKPINVYTKEHFLTYLSLYLSAYLRENQSLVGVYEAFKSTFSDIQTSYPYERSGTTFLGVFLIKNLIFSVSIGDSKGLLITPFSKSSIALSADPSHPYFKEKLTKNNVRIIPSKHTHTLRIEGTLNMATALGDKHIKTIQGKPAIKPSMSFVAIPKEWIQTPAHIVLGSDGVFDFLSQEDIQKIAQTTLSESEAAKKILEAAFKNGSRDNLSCIVINLNNSF